MKKIIKKAARYAVLAVVLYTLFLAITLPAPRAYQLFKGQMGSIALYGVGGTVMRGHAAQLTARHVQLSQVSWQLHPWALLLGRVEARVDFQNDAVPGHAVIGRSLGGKVYFKDVAARLPASLLDQVINIPGVKWDGKLDVQLSGLSIEKGYIAEADGTLLWNKAAMVTPWPLALGAFLTTLESTEEGVKVTLADKGGAVQAEGLFLLKSDGKYQFTANFSSRDTKQPNIAQALKFLGNPGADGRVKVSTTGNFPPLQGPAPAPVAGPVKTTSTPLPTPAK